MNRFILMTNEQVHPLVTNEQVHPLGDQWVSRTLNQISMTKHFWEILMHEHNKSDNMLYLN